MKRKIFLLPALAVMCLAGAPAWCGELSMQERREQKLQSDFLKKAPWLTDYDQALAESKRTGKHILVYFTRSYAYCYYCAKTEKGVFSEPAFPAFAQGVVLFCHVTTRVKGDPYQELFSDKGGTGFPYIAILDAQGNVLSPLQGGRSISGFKQTMAKAGQFLELEKKAANGDLATKVEFAATVIENGDRLRAAKQRSALGKLSSKLQARLHVADMRVAMRARRYPDAVKAGRQALALAPDYFEALKTCATASFRSKNGVQAFRFAEKAVRLTPDDGFLNFIIADFMAKRSLAVLALPAARQALKKTPKNKYLQRIISQSKDRGCESYKSGKTVTVGELQMTLYTSVGPVPAAGKFREYRCYVFRRQGFFDHALTHSEYTDAKSKKLKQKLTLVTLDKSLVMRMSEEPWSAEVVQALVLKTEPAVAHLLAAQRHRQDGLRPLETAAVNAGLALDPDNLMLLRGKNFLASLGWDVCTTSEPQKVGQFSLRLYKPVGEKQDKRWVRRSQVAIIWDAAGKKALRHYAVWAQPAKKKRYRIELRDGMEKVAVRLARSPWADEDFLKIVRSTEAAMPHLRKAKALIVAGQYVKEGTPKLIEAIGQCEAALRKDPELVEAAQELVRCYLFISDREPGTDLETAAYERGMGAIQYLLKRDLRNWVGRLAKGVFAYRFKVYPWAAYYMGGLKSFPAAKTRALEILGTLEAIGQNKYKYIKTKEIDGFQMLSFARIPDAKTPLPDGLRVIEHCFIGLKNYGYRFHFSYREQKMGDVVERDLVFGRLHRSSVVRTFEKKPTENELKAEILKVLEGLKTEPGRQP